LQYIRMQSLFLDKVIEVVKWVNRTTPTTSQSVLFEEPEKSVEGYVCFISVPTINLAIDFISL
jgi:hypothetical protein